MIESNMYIGRQIARVVDVLALIGCQLVECFDCKFCLSPRWDPPDHQNWRTRRFRCPKESFEVARIISSSLSVVGPVVYTTLVGWLSNCG